MKIQLPSKISGHTCTSLQKETPLLVQTLMQRQKYLILKILLFVCFADRLLMKDTDSYSFKKLTKRQKKVQQTFKVSLFSLALNFKIAAGIKKNNKTAKLLGCLKCI